MIRRRRAFLLHGGVAAICLAAIGAHAEVQVEGVRFPEAMQIAGADVSLNGAGLRTKVWKLYACGLYVEKPSADADELIGTAQVKHMELHMLRDLTKAQVGKTIREGFERNSQTEMPKLATRLDRLTEGLPNVKRGEVLTVTYAPGRGTMVRGPRNDPIVLEGDDFMRALFSVWLGPSPVQLSLKNDLLGRSLAASSVVP